MKLFTDYILRRAALGEKKGNHKKIMENRRTVLITGATSGIGLALAQEFARQGCRLVLTASRRERLTKVASRLGKRFPTCVIAAISQDLAAADGAVKLYRQIKKRNLTVDVLVNNAGFGMVGEEISLPLSGERAMLGVNVSALTELTHLFLAEMCARGKGKILNVASVGAFQPGPYTAAYYATKAYVANYSRALRVEAKRYGVGISVLCPGTTRTGFFHRAGASAPMWAMSPARVARIAFRGLEKNREIIIPGVGNRLLQWLPERVKLLGIALIKKGGNAPA